MKVKATRLGFDGMKRIKAGQVFEAITPQEKIQGKKGVVFSGNWMKKLETEKPSIQEEKQVEIENTDKDELV